MEQIQARDGEDTYVANFGTIGKLEGKVLSWTTWGEGVKGLLPRTDLVTFVGSAVGATPLLVPWAEVQRVAGALMSPQGLSPERWLVEQFPSSDQLRAMTAMSGPDIENV